MDTAAATDTWSTSRLRRRRTPSVSMLDVMEINGDEDDDYVPPKPKGRKAQKTVIVRAPEVEKARRTSLGKPAIELHMECFDDALSTAQLRANHLAKEAHALAMKQIQAAHEGRLSFKHDGTPIIHAQPILIHTPTVPSPVTANQTVNRGGYGVNLRAIQQIQSYNTQRRNLLGQTVTLTMTPIARPQLPQNSIPVGRVVAQPRKLPLVTQPVSGTSGFGVKRSFQELQNQVNLSSYEADAKKKRKSLEDEGDWVPLDEFYYGKLEGNAMYMEEKGEFRFKCWYCNKMLYNNLKAMMHLQSHIDSEKQQNLDLSDLTQCKHCYKQFDTPFEMQTHIEKVHLSNSSILMCRICEKDHDSNHALSQHMRNTHNAREMPYRCQCCNFQSSMYGDVVDHFRKKHDSSQNLLCLYCLRAFKVKIVNNRWGSTQNYYHHLVKHQSKSRSKKCPSCKLAFISPGELKTHQKKDHVSNSKAARMAAPTGFGAQQQVLIQVKGNVAGSGVKSLNAPAVMKHLDLSRLRIPEYAGLHHCFECKGSMSNVDHFKNHKECSMCRYATTCSSAYANHMLSFHSGRSALTTYLRVTREHPLPARRYCACGFSSRFGNKIANHMVFCYKRTCYSERPDPNRLASPEEPEVDPRRRPGASILDALGLVKKQTAKRSADGTEIVETPPNHAEMEEFVGVTNLSMAQTLRDTADQMALDNEKADDPDFEDGDSDVADVASDDDNDADFRPGRFSKPPKLDRPRQSGSTMFVKMNFFKNKQKKETPVKSLSPSETDSSAVTAPPSDDSGEVSKSETSAVIAPSGGDSMDGTSATSAITAPSADNSGEVMKLSEDKNGSDENLDQDETANTEQSKEAESHNIGQSVVREGEASEQSENKMSGEVESNESKITNDVRADNKIDTAVSENGEEKAVENSATQDSGNAESILERTSEADLVSENATTEAKSDEITTGAAEDGMETEVSKQGDELAEEGTANQGEDISEMDVENEESETKSSVATPNDEPIDLDREDAEPMETEEERRTESSVLDEELREETADGASKGSKSEDSSMKPDESSTKPDESSTKPDESSMKQDESSVKPDESSMKQDHENNTEEMSPANEENVQNDLPSEDQETLGEPMDPSEVEKSSDVTQKESEDVSESQNSDKSPEDDSSGKNKPEHSTEGDSISEGKGMETSKVANPESIVHETPVGISEASESGLEPSKLEESEAPKSLPEDETVPSVEEKDSSNNKEREPSEVRLASKEQETKNSSESPSKMSRWGKTDEDSPSKRYSDSGDYYRKGGDRDSHGGHRSGSSSYDRSDRHHGDSHHRHDRGYDSGYHGSRYDRDRDDKYRDRGSDRRYDDRGYSSRDHNRHDNRGYSSRDYDRHGNRYDRDQGHRRDSHGNRQNRYDNQRRDYY